MHIKEAIAGAAVGAVLVAGGVIAYKLGQANPQDSSGEIHAVAITREPGPIYQSTSEICQKLASLGCSGIPAQLLNGETESAACQIAGRSCRISIYPSFKAIEQLATGYSGRTLYGEPLDIVVGENWTVTVSPYGGSHEAIEAVHKVLGGVVLLSKES